MYYYLQKNLKTTEQSYTIMTLNNGKSMFTFVVIIIFDSRLSKILDDFKKQEVLLYTV